MGLAVGVCYLICLTMEVLGLLLHIVGLATPEWSYSDNPEDNSDLDSYRDGSMDYDYDYADSDERNLAKLLFVGENIKLYTGLWECCSEGSSGSYCLSASECVAALKLLDIDLSEGIYKAMGGLAIIAMIAQMVSVGLAVTFVILPILGKKYEVRLAHFSSAVVVVAVLCVMLCVGCCGVFVLGELTKLGANIGYSFWLCVAGGSLTKLGGVMAYVDISHSTPPMVTTPTTPTTPAIFITSNTPNTPPTSQ